MTAFPSNKSINVFQSGKYVECFSSSVLRTAQPDNLLAKGFFPEVTACYACVRFSKVYRKILYKIPLEWHRCLKNALERRQRWQGLNLSYSQMKAVVKHFFSRVLSAAKECFNGTVFWDLLIFTCCRKWCKLFERQGGSTEISSTIFFLYSSSQKTTEKLSHIHLNTAV